MAYKTVVTNPSPLVRQTIEFLRQMTERKGEFSLAMLLPSETGLSDKWNLVLSARWIDGDGLSATIPTITAALLKHLSKANAHKLERVSVVPTSDPLVVFAVEELHTPLGQVSFAQRFWGRPDPARAGIPQLEDAYVLVADQASMSGRHRSQPVQTRA